MHDRFDRNEPSEVHPLLVRVGEHALRRIGVKGSFERPQLLRQVV